MAGFEIVVRPVVFPAIRPAPAQPVPPADDPEQGFATIHGNGARQVSTSYSYSSSISSSQRTEIERRVDVARVYQKDDSGKINKKNFVDIEVANRIKMKGPPSQKAQNDLSFTDADGNRIAMTGDDFSGMMRYWDSEKQVYYYQNIQEHDNIEIRKRNEIKKKEEAGGAS